MFLKESAKMPLHWEKSFFSRRLFVTFEKERYSSRVLVLNDLNFLDAFFLADSVKTEHEFENACETFLQAKGMKK